MERKKAKNKERKEGRQVKRKTKTPIEKTVE